MLDKWEDTYTPGDTEKLNPQDGLESLIKKSLVGNGFTVRVKGKEVTPSVVKQPDIGEDAVVVILACVVLNCAVVG